MAGNPTPLQVNKHHDSTITVPATHDAAEVGAANLAWIQDARTPHLVLFLHRYLRRIPLFEKLRTFTIRTILIPPAFERLCTSVSSEAIWKLYLYFDLESKQRAKLDVSQYLISTHAFAPSQPLHLSPPNKSTSSSPSNSSPFDHTSPASLHTRALPSLPVQLLLTRPLPLRPP